MEVLAGPIQDSIAVYRYFNEASTLCFYIPARLAEASSCWLLLRTKESRD